MTLNERYRDIYARLYGFKDFCDEQHHHVMRELEKELASRPESDGRSMTRYEQLERLKIEADRWVAGVGTSPTNEMIASASRGIRELLDKAILTYEPQKQYKVRRGAKDKL